MSRNLTHELIRHRWFTFSQVSLRYVDASVFDLAIPPALTNRRLARRLLRCLLRTNQAVYMLLAWHLSRTGLSRKQAREAARAILPSGLETRIVVSGNLRAWRDLIRQRLTPHADAEFRNLAQELLRQLNSIAPNTVQDLTPRLELYQ